MFGLDCLVVLEAFCLGRKGMEIKRDSKADEILLFDMIADEGDDWSDYHGPAGRGKYIKRH